MFKRFTLLALALVPALAIAFASPRHANADPRDFTFYNSSGLTITQLFVAPSSSNDWGTDILGAGVLPPGQSINVVFQRFDGTTCFYDVRVVDETGATHEEYQFDLCSTTDITFS